MAFESHESGPLDTTAPLSRRLSRLSQLLRSAEACLEHALDELDRVTGGPSGACAGEWSRPVPRGPRPAGLPTAMTFSVDDGSCASWVVEGVERRMRLSPVRFELLRMLAAPTSTAPEGMVGFKAPAAIVRTLRECGCRATRRSVIVEIARLRQALGEGGEALIETRRGLGYRFRVLQPRVPDTPCA